MSYTGKIYRPIYDTHSNMLKASHEIPALSDDESHFNDKNETLTRQYYRFLKSVECYLWDE